MFHQVPLQTRSAGPSPSRQKEKFDATSPNIVIETLTLPHAEIYVVRDDLLPGGTKQRGLRGALEDFKARGITRFVYVSPFCGYAQLALSYLCKCMGLECVLFCEPLPGSSDMQPHPYTQQAQLWGAEIHLVKDLAHGQVAAADFCQTNPEFMEIPLGFDCDEFYSHYATALEKQWRVLIGSIGCAPTNLWVSIGSGTLVRSFKRVIQDPEVRIRGINVHVLAATDPRIAGLSQTNRVTVLEAPVPFHTPTDATIGIPSNVFYDAKVIPFLQRYAVRGDVFWNVGR